MLKGKELKRDMETVLLSAQVKSAGSTSAARNLAGILCWIATNDDFASDGSSPSPVDGTDARNDGTQRAFTEAQLKNALQLLALEHGHVIKLVVTAGVLNGALRPRNASHLVRNLEVVPQTDGRRHGIRGRIVTFKHRVGRNRSSESLRLPLVQDRLSLLRLAHRDEGRIGRVNVVDHVGQVLTIANSLVSRPRVGW
jgi:hypothetical protein